MLLWDTIEARGQESAHVESGEDVGIQLVFEKYALPSSLIVRPSNIAFIFRFTQFCIFLGLLPGISGPSALSVFTSYS